MLSDVQFNGVPDIPLILSIPLFYLSITVIYSSLFVVCLTTLLQSLPSVNFLDIMLLSFSLFPPCYLPYRKPSVNRFTRLTDASSLSFPHIPSSSHFLPVESSQTLTQNPKNPPCFTFFFLPCYPYIYSPIETHKDKHGARYQTIYRSPKVSLLTFQLE
jgi:hypothetical protein